MRQYQNFKNSHKKMLLEETNERLSLTYYLLYRISDMASIINFYKNECLTEVFFHFSNFDFFVLFCNQSFRQHCQIFCNQIDQKLSKNAESKSDLSDRIWQHYFERKSPAISNAGYLTSIFGSSRKMLFLSLCSGRSRLFKQ